MEEEFDEVACVRVCIYHDELIGRAWTRTWGFRPFFERLLGSWFYRVPGKLSSQTLLSTEFPG